MRPLILWVDDRADANIYERTRLVESGYAVEQATSTATALRVLSTVGSVETIISDMGRVENGGVYNAQAGLDLVRSLRKEGDQTPVVFYSSSKSLSPVVDELSSIPNVAYTTSPTELIRLLGLTGSTG